MYEDHEVFQPPTNPDVSIWRYMDLAKFVSMLEAQALHFARADIMDDAFEGSISRATVEERRRVLSGQIPDEAFDALTALWSDTATAVRDHAYLNCWHMNEHESVAMWKIYQSGEPQGIAIRSTFRRLVESITDERPVYVGTVSYIDFDTEIIPSGNAFYPFVHKRKSYDYEREIRAVHVDSWVQDAYLREEGFDEEDVPVGFAFTPPRSPVIPISVDLDKLVESVYVSPKAREWFAQLVRDLLGRYGRGWTVNYSSIDGEPIFQ